MSVVCVGSEADRVDQALVCVLPVSWLTPGELCSLDNVPATIDTRLAQHNSIILLKMGSNNLLEF